MVEIWQAILLGIVQGITEWLPVSSKGNVAILGQFLGLSTSYAFNFAIMLHIGTLIAAIVYFRKELKAIVEGKENEKKNFIVYALIGTAITAIPCYILLKKILETQQLNAFGITIHSQTLFLIVVGIFVLVTGILQLSKKNQTDAQLSKKNGFWVGLGQGLTVLPGMSRSGTTASVMLFEGFSPEKAFENSFLLSIPTVFLGEIALQLVEHPALEPSLIAGIIASAIAGYFSMGFLITIAKRINFGKFCIALAIFYFVIASLSIALPLVA